jgi:hypothetical protein
MFGEPIPVGYRPCLTGRRFAPSRTLKNGSKQSSSQSRFGTSSDASHFLNDTTSIRHAEPPYQSHATLLKGSDVIISGTFFTTCRCREGPSLRWSRISMRCGPSRLSRTPAWNLRSPQRTGSDECSLGIRGLCDPSSNIRRIGRRSSIDTGKQEQGTRNREPGTRNQEPGPTPHPPPSPSPYCDTPCRRTPSSP